MMAANLPRITKRFPAKCRGVLLNGSSPIGNTSLLVLYLPRAYRRGFSFLDNPPGATRGLDKLRKGRSLSSATAAARFTAHERRWWLVESPGQLPPSFPQGSFFSAGLRL